MNQQRNNHTVIIRKVIPFTIVVSGILGIYLTNAQTVSVDRSVHVSGNVYTKSVNPAPPPTPNPIPNNGIPLPQIISGTDSAVFRGLAYPDSAVSIFKNGLILHESKTNSLGAFEIPVKNIMPGTYTFSLIAKDMFGNKSSTLTYTIIIESGITTEVSGIIMSPTITTDKSEVKLGDMLTFSGMSVPRSEVSLHIFARTGIVKTAITNASGTWSYRLSSSLLDMGDYNAKAKLVSSNNGQDLFSDPVLFTVGDKNTLRKKGDANLINARCDLNNDLRVNLLDFSIMAFWYKRMGFPLKVDLNSDGRINLTDLSILAYCWTG